MRRIITVAVLFLLVACAPPKAEIPLNEIPAGPLLQALDEHRQSFRSLKGLASIEIKKWGMTRTIENAGIIIDRQNRLRLDAYGPLGNVLMAMIWDGGKPSFFSPEDETLKKQGTAALDQLFGDGLDMRELCALLSGTVPASFQTGTAIQWCGHNNECLLQIQGKDTVRKITVIYPASHEAKEPGIISEEFYRNGGPLYKARFHHRKTVSPFIPMIIKIERPSQNVSITISYQEVDVNIPINKEDFLLMLE